MLVCILTTVVFCKKRLHYFQSTNHAAWDWSLVAEVVPIISQGSLVPRPPFNWRRLITGYKILSLSGYSLKLTPLQWVFVQTPNCQSLEMKTEQFCYNSVDHCTWVHQNSLYCCIVIRWMDTLSRGDLLCNTALILQQPLNTRQPATPCNRHLGCMQRITSIRWTLVDFFCQTVCQHFWIATFCLLSKEWVWRA